jgi:hypothetical protein
MKNSDTTTTIGKLALLLVLSLFYFNSYSAFEKLHDLGEGQMTYHEVIETQTGFVGISIYTGGITLTNIDNLGDTLWSKNHQLAGLISSPKIFEDLSTNDLLVTLTQEQSGTKDISIVRFNSQGVLISSASLGLTLNSNQYLNHAIRTMSGGFAFVGGNYVNNSGLFIISSSVSGSILFNKTFTYPGSKSIGTYIDQKGNGEYIVSAIVEGLNSGSATEFNWVLDVAVNGDSTKSYKFLNGASTYSSVAAIEASNNDIFVSMRVNNQQIRAAKIRNGSILFDQINNLSIHNSLPDRIETLIESNGTFIASTGFFGGLFQFDLNGNLIYENSDNDGIINNPDTIFNPYSCYELSSGGYLIAGNCTVYDALGSGVLIPFVRLVDSLATGCSSLTFQNNSNTPGSHYVYTCDSVGIDLSQGLTISGGTQPYTYQWYHAQGPSININNPTSFNATIDTVVDPTQDWFLLYVTDANGCQIYDTVYVVQDSGCGSCASLAFQNNSNTSGSHYVYTCDSVGIDLSQGLSIIGGTQPYTYQWSVAQVSSIVINNPTSLNATIDTLVDPTQIWFLLYVTDANGCQIYDTVYVVQDTGCGSCVLKIDSVSTNPGVALDATVHVSGVSGPLTYFWSDGFVGTQAHHLFVFPGNYCVTITDQAGCSDTACFVIDTISCSSFMFQNNSSTIGTHYVYTCDTVGINLSQGLSIVGGTAPFTYQWVHAQGPAININNPNTFNATIDTVVDPTQDWFLLYVSDANGCQIGDSVFVIQDTGCYGDTVWPGDANADGVANIVDILPIGIAYGSTGPVRANATINWVGQVATDWGSSFVTGADYKHADCDGSGLVDQNDLSAILQNYGLTHSKGDGNTESLATNPAMTVDLTMDTVGLSTLITAQINLGDAINQAANVYGVTFSLNYDPALVDPSTVQVGYGNSWLGDATNNNDMVTLDKNFETYGKIDIGMTRTNQANNSGMGEICAVDIFITDDLSGKQTAFETLELFLSNVKIISYDETEIDVNLTSDSVVISDDPVLAVGEMTSESIQLYPNPNSGIIRIAGASQNYQIDIISVMGQRVYSNMITSDSNIDISHLNNGVYLVNITNASGLIKTQKLIKE